jgi:hypothetical protein
MLEPGGRLRLAAEALDELRRCPGSCDEELERDLARYTTPMPPRPIFSLSS